METCEVYIAWSGASARLLTLSSKLPARHLATLIRAEARHQYSCVSSWLDNKYLDGPAGEVAPHKLLVSL